MGLGLNVLNRDRLKGDVGNGVAGLIDHVGPAVFAHLNGGDDIVQESLLRDKIHNTRNGGTVDSVFIKWSRNHNGQLSGNLADQRLRYIDIALHGLLHIFTVRIILSVKNADAVKTNNISPLKIVHGTALVDNGTLLIKRYGRIGQLRDAACVHSHVFVSGQLLLHTLRGQNGGFTHHVVYSGDGAVIVRYDAGYS